MQTEVAKIILKLITQMPGISGIVSLNFNDELSILKPEDYEKGISVIVNGQGKYIVNVAVVVSSYVRAKVVISEMSEAIKSALEKMNVIVDKMNVYVRGVN